MKKIIGINASGYKFGADSVDTVVKMTVNTNGGMSGGMLTFYLKCSLSELEGLDKPKVFTTFTDERILINPRYISTAKMMKLVKVDVSRLKWNGISGPACRYDEVDVPPMKWFYVIEINDTYEVVGRNARTSMFAEKIYEQKNDE